MKKMTVKDKHGRILFTGTKSDCMHFIKRHGYNRAEITIQSPQDAILEQPHYETTAPIELKPKGIWKRIFK